MASAAAHAVMAANTFTRAIPKQKTTYFFSKRHRKTDLTLRASTEDSDCNVEECAPEKEVGKVSVEWLAGEKTKVSGTFPPRNTRGWTGYVEKDTAGQTNIYSVEPAVYVAESVISSGSAGSSSDGSENTAAVAFGFALISIAAASSILLQVGKNPPEIQKVEYSGPSLSYYINKLKPQEIIQASAPSVSESSSTLQQDTSPPEPSQVQPESEVQPEPSI
ncbi:protein MAINTENANCE OF PSII UNDER HIGH LIGHT 1 [Argentina anserina]|uniref:protein MAINTENANCE OF PSII UNDER HIGH LIGHT 1 n=1 Tax=Argentina anserina TaxID=57926 RepID=UPI0021768FE3|nr:protein MAINTENANCE OF PSII UNDER HIGH LIGHT 1 [Potentilla anserina]